LGVSFDSEHAWLWRRRNLPSRDPNGELQGEQFMLGAMIKVTRQAAGQLWAPPAIRLDSRSARWLKKTRDLKDCQLSTGGPVMAIALPIDMLDQPLPGSSSSSVAIGSQSEKRAIPNDFVGSLHAALTSASYQTPLSLELGAEIAETSPRTLRRWLSQEGTSWRDLTDRIRFERATQLVQHSSLTLAEVSGDLGYSDPAHFTRAFRRWTGEAPSEYRQRRMNTDSSPKEIHH
jgi:AraC-like DNA-binding protein